MDEISELKHELQDVVHRADRESAGQSVIEAKVKVLADILSPTNLRIQNREAAKMVAMVDALRDEVKALRAKHNGSHQ